MIDTDKYEAYKPTQSNYQTSDRYIKELLTEVKRLREEQKQIHDLLAEVLPRKDGVPHMGTVLWGLESELKRAVGEIAIILGMAEREEE